MKILVDAKQGLGDCVQLIPMLEIIKENYPDCYLAALVRNEASASILRMSPVKIDRFYYFSSTIDTKLGLLKLVCQLRREKFDYFILSPITTGWKAKLFAFLTGTKYCLGEQYKNYDLYKRDNAVHMVVRNVECIREFCKIPKLVPTPRLLPPLFTKYDDIFNTGNTIIGICISKATPLFVKSRKVYPRAWETRKWGEIIEKLLQKNYRVILFGGQEDLSEVEALGVDLNNKQIVNLVAKTTLAELTYIVSKCSCVAGVDTGTQHIADAVGTRTISLFGPTNPKTHGAFGKKAEFVECDEKLECKYCFGKSYYSKCNIRKCMFNISVNKFLNL